MKVFEILNDDEDGCNQNYMLLHNGVVESNLEMGPNLPLTLELFDDEDGCKQNHMLLHDEVVEFRDG